MNRLPQELLREIVSYLDLLEYQETRAAYKLFHCKQIYTKLIFQHCKHKITPKIIKNGTCACVQCNRQKAICIELDPIRSRTLCNYCAIHARIYLDFNLNELL